ncbi:hypothetical protein [Oceanobacillus senegalensis]|uniref:hypothetical protein n=1 Tax=Oceanobacillus senegalensis TaxID=1936063 RepID=UPI000A304DE0|nr:hypothetical protein [Oceanobacillus senegalensis]
MEGLFEAIFSNFFLILIVISGIIGFFRNNSGEDQKKKQSNRPMRPETPSNRNQRADSHSKPINQSSPTMTMTVEEQQQQQMERLASRLKTNANQPLDDNTENPMINENLAGLSSHNYSKEQKELKRQIGTNLKGKGLIQGIIMSEVLGSPRGRSPYRNVIQKRQMK